MPFLELTILLLILWLIRQIKGILFWLYVWQLKEYHIGRFADHFRTNAGKKSLLNKVSGLKLLLIFGLLGFLYMFTASGTLLIWAVVLLLYGVEVGKMIIDMRKRRLRRPTFTKKTLFLFVVCSAFVFGVGLGIFVYEAFIVVMIIRNPFAIFIALPVGLLAIDLLMPVIVSAAVLALQPFTVLARKRIIKQAKEKREKFKNLKVIGITGSYGKTSTKEFLARILEQKFRVLKTPKHQNSEVGISNTILRSLTDEHDIFVCEMGAYNKGGIKLLAGIAKPQIGIVTGVNEQHLATFGSMENLLSAEGGEELVRALPSHGVAFINQNSRLRSLSYGGQAKIKYYAIGEKADVEAQDVKVEKDEVFFRLGGISFRVPVYGGHNVQNLLGAIAASRELGMSLEEIAKACETITPDLGALKVKRGVNGVTIIDSTYSANPDGVIADLEYLSLYEGKKILIMPCLIELGKASKDAHIRIGKKIAEVCDLAIITTKEHFEDIAEGALLRQGYGGREKQDHNLVFLESAQAIGEKIKNFVGAGGTVLLEGGKESRIQRYLLRMFQT